MPCVWCRIFSSRTARRRWRRFVPVRWIRSIRAVHHQRHLRGDGEGRAEGPAGPHLLLGGKDKGTVHGQFIPQEGEQHGAAQPAPQRLSLEQARPEVSGVTVKGRRISQSDLRLRPGPVPGSDVDIELVHSFFHNSETKIAKGESRNKFIW